MPPHTASYQYHLDGFITRSNHFNDCAKSCNTKKIWMMKKYIFEYDFNAQL